ncbi:hypothetical protein DOE73_23120 [Paenibacillus dendritiformis]|nr:hypothetical protein DOE73_23120 [Paenibacillus dendritiformis]
MSFFFKIHWIRRFIFWIYGQPLEFARGFELLGMALGWLVGYFFVLGMRTIQNSLTSYFNFEMGEKTIVLASIAFFGILGWFISRKKTAASSL